MEGIPAAVKSLVAKVGSGFELLPAERQQLYDQLHQLGQAKMQQYEADRGDFTERAQRRGFNVKDVLNTAVTPDMTDRGTVGGGRLSDDENAAIDQSYNEQQNPGAVDTITNFVQGLF
jgi:hypothetical protein